MYYLHETHVMSKRTKLSKLAFWRRFLANVPKLVGFWFLVPNFFFPNPKTDRRWVIYGRAQIVEVDINGDDGSIIQYAARIEHDTFESMSPGLAFMSSEICVDFERNSWLGKIDLEYDGPRL